MIRQKTQHHSNVKRVCDSLIARCKALRIFELIIALMISSVVFAEQSAKELVTAGCEKDYPPFCIVHSDGNADGFSVELLRAVLNKMGCDVAFRNGVWADVSGWLERGEVQALPLVGRTSEREKIFDFTFPYMTMHGAIVVRKETSDVHRLRDLIGRKICVMQNDNAEEFLRRDKRDFEISTTATFLDAFQELSEGRCDAVVIQRLVAIRLLEESGLNNLKIVDTPIRNFSQDFCFAVKKGDSQLLSLLNEGLSLVMADGTHRRLHSKWFAHLELPHDRPIIVGGDQNYPPFEFLDATGRPSGFSVELTQAIARELGLNIKIQLGSWGEIVEALHDGKIDALEGMFYSPERDILLDFSPKYLVVDCVSVVRKDEGIAPASFKELAGRKLVVQSEDAMMDKLTEYNLDKNMIIHKTQEDVLRAVSEGQNLCGLVTRMSALNAIKQHGWTNLKVSDQALYSGEYCYAVRTGNDALLTQFTEGLQVLKSSGEYQRIYEKWLSVHDPRVSVRDIIKYGALVILPLLSIALLALLWSWSLRRQVGLQTNELRVSNSQLQEAYEIINRSSSVAFTWSKGDGWPVEFVSENVYKLLGYTAEEFISGKLSYLDCIHPDDVMRIHDELDLFLSQQDVEEFVHEPYRVIAKDGTVKVVRDWTFIVRNAEGSITHHKGIVEDITKQRSLENQLAQAQKMEAVGRLAGGVAHDYNNMLNVIIGYSELALENQTLHDPLRSYLKEIYAAANRSKSITEQLLAFARKETISPQTLNLNTAVEKLLSILMKLIGEDITLQWHPFDGILPVLLDPSQLDQVLVNLCVNARDAVSDVGKITIETDIVEIDADYCDLHSDFKPGKFVLLAVSDDGMGMDRATLEHIFEPFFTTKEIGKGTGLGLSMVYGIIKQNQGFINVYSEPDCGTTFRIYLPWQAGELAEIKAPADDCRVKGSGTTILVVEDELSILRMTEQILKQYDFNVLTAGSPPDALEIARAYHGDIALLITDVVMPGINGSELAEEVKKLYPSLKCLFMSGYTANVIAQRGILKPGINFIQKPFAVKALIAKINDMLA